MTGWKELALAFCLVLVLEGIIPFLAPNRWRNLAARLAQTDDQTMRIAGFISMIIGTALLYLIH